MSNHLMTAARIWIALVGTAGMVAGCTNDSPTIHNQINQRGDTNASGAEDEVQTVIGKTPPVEKSTAEKPVLPKTRSSDDPQTRTFWSIGYNEVRQNAPIHIHFADKLPTNFGPDQTAIAWDWKRWKTGTEKLLKDELFPLLGAYEHYYYLIDYEGYDADDEAIVRQVQTVGDNPRMTREGFTGISGMHINDDGWRVPLHLSRIPDEAHMQHIRRQYKHLRPEECLIDQLRSSVIHEYHHVMMWHQMMNNYQSRNSGGTVAEPDYLPPWFGEGAAGVLPYLMGTDNGREGLRNRIEHVLERVKADQSLNDWS